MLCYDNGKPHLEEIAVSKTVWWNEYSFATVLSDFSLSGAFDT